MDNRPGWIDEVLQVGNFAEHFGAERQDEREAEIAQDAGDRNADQIALVVEHSAPRDARMAIGAIAPAIRVKRSDVKVA